MTTATRTDPATLRRKALTVLRSGRLTILEAAAESPGDVTRVVARVRSSRPGSGAYAVDLNDFGWACTCLRQQPCAHIEATKLVTGHHKGRP